MNQNKQHFIKPWQIFFLMIFVLSFLALKVWEWHWPEGEVILKDQSLTVLLADNPKHRYQGLSGREDFGEYDGMLFILGDYSRPGFVMREMNFPIDIVWIRDQVVVDIAPRLKPQPGVSEADLQGYFPRTEANFVLELPAGWSEVQDLKIGDNFQFLGKN